MYFLNPCFKKCIKIVISVVTIAREKSVFTLHMVLSIAITINSTLLFWRGSIINNMVSIGQCFDFDWNNNNVVQWLLQSRSSTYCNSDLKISLSTFKHDQMGNESKYNKKFKRGRNLKQWTTHIYESPKNTKNVMIWYRLLWLWAMAIENVPNGLHIYCNSNKHLSPIPQNRIIHDWG